jgi:hypothetical protein
MESPQKMSAMTWRQAKFVSIILKKNTDTKKTTTTTNVGHRLKPIYGRIDILYRLYNKTDLYFLDSKYDVICTEKKSLTLAFVSVNIVFFQYISHHIHQLKSQYLYNICSGQFIGIFLIIVYSYFCVIYLFSLYSFSVTIYILMPYKGFVVLTRHRNETNNSLYII